MGAFAVNDVEYIDGTHWYLGGIFSDLTGSFTGLSITIDNKILQRGIDTGNRWVYDRYRITNIVNQKVDTLQVIVVSDFTNGIQNRDGFPYSGNFPIAEAVMDTSKLTYRPSLLYQQIDEDYNAAFDNLNLYVTKQNATPWKKETTSDGENNWTVPFTLTSSSTILYNNTPLRPSQWSGLGLTTLTVNLDVRKYDYLVILNQ